MSPPGSPTTQRSESSRPSSCSAPTASTIACRSCCSAHAALEMTSPPVAAEASAPILAVDDTPANLLALTGILEPLRQRIVTARSGAEALDLASRDTFAVILLDVMMPNMDGFATLARLRAMPSAQSTPVILLTGYDLDVRAMDRLQ